MTDTNLSTAWLAGRTALITGGGRGIGKAVALHLASLGARIIVTGRTVAEIDAVAHETGGLAIRMDAADRGSIAALVDQLRERALHVDVLVNNAGVAGSAPYDRTSDELWDNILAVNVTAPFALCRALMPAMVAARWGRVIQIASTAGLTGHAYTSAYCASKHALIGMTRAMALEVARSGVTVNAVCPGWVKTDIATAAVERIAQKTGRDEVAAQKTLEAMSPQNRMLEPEEVAHLVGSLCAPDARGIHGQALVIDGGQVLH